MKEIQKEAGFDRWHGCYNQGWGTDLVPDAYSHPAKISRSLIYHIYEHAFAAGWLVPGDVVVDLFAGIAGTALDALWNGLAWVGVELEPKFVALAQANLTLWQRRYGQKEGWGSARILQGDSRQLASVFQSAECVISSPPYAGNEKSDYLLSDDGKTRQRDVKRGFKQGHGCFRGSETYGNGPGQLGAMKEGEPPRVDVEIVVSSPPFSHPNEQPVASQSKLLKEGYEKFKSPAKMARGDTDGSLNREQWETFWSSAREIVAQCHSILQPGGHAIFVCKDFVRKGKRIPFSNQWQALCESQGFRLICRHRAMLVKVHGAQGLLEGGVEILETRRISFFRRLAEKNGSPRIEWEDVLCLQKLI